MSHHHHEDKKDKKKAQAKKNRFHFEMFNLLRLRRLEDDRVKGLKESQKSKPAQTTAEVADKTAEIRNRLTNQKRLSRERWNRFAGTSSGGGRGL